MLQAMGLIQFMAYNKPQAGDNAAGLPTPQFRPSGKGTPVSQFYICLLAAGFAPNVKMPAPEGPIPGLWKKPEPIKDSVPMKGQQVRPPARFFPKDNRQQGNMNQQGMGEQYSRLVATVEIKQGQRLVDQIWPQRRQGDQAVITIL